MLTYINTVYLLSETWPWWWSKTNRNTQNKYSISC